MTEKELMQAGCLYHGNDADLKKAALRSRQLVRLINSTTEEQREYRIELFKKLFKKTGDNFWVEPPFRCDYGCNIQIGNNFYAIFDCIILDDGEVVIGDNVFLGPRVCIYTAGHPIDAEVRNTNLEYGKKIIIGDHVWVGGCTIINPGIVIGDNVVIGSGSVVTKDIPSNVVAAGNPCKVIRKITLEDHLYWKEQERLYRSNRKKNSGEME